MKNLLTFPLSNIFPAKTKNLVQILDYRRSRIQQEGLVAVMGVFKLILLIFMNVSCQKTEYLNLSLTPLQRGTVMDPSRIYFLNEYYLIENLSARLVEMDSKSGYKFMLASKIEQDSDLEYRIQIRTTHFSNGDPLTLEDVKASFERALSKTGSHVQLK